MSFVSTLNEYCILLDCSSKDLAERSGISPSTLSRYRSGRRTPVYDGESVRKLAQGIVAIARERNVEGIGDVEDVMAGLSTGLNHSSESFSRKLDALMRKLRISNVEMSREVAIDPSYLSRIRNGRRSPADAQGLARRCAEYIVSHRENREVLDETLTTIAGDDAKRARSGEEMIELITRWLLD